MGAIDQQADHRLALGVGDLVVGVGDAAQEIREGRDPAGLVGRHVRQGLLERVECLDVGLAFVDVDVEAELAQDGGQHARSIEPISSTRRHSAADASRLAALLVG